MLDQFLPYILNGAGGAIIGPLISQFLGGKHQGLMTRILAGIVGGVGAGQAANMGHYGDMLSGVLADPGMRSMIQHVLEGAVGGGVLSSAAGFLPKRKA